MKSSLFSALLLLAAVAGVQAAESQANPEPPKTQTRAAGGAFKNVDLQEFEKLRRDTNNIVLDVRTPREFATGHIPGAVNIDVNAPDFGTKVATLDKNKTYLVHCAAGVRSAKACDKLNQLN